VYACLRKKNAPIAFVYFFQCGKSFVLENDHKHIATYLKHTVHYSCHLLPNGPRQLAAIKLIDLRFNRVVPTTSGTEPSSRRLRSVPYLEHAIQPYVLSTRTTGPHLTASQFHSLSPTMPLTRQDTVGTTVIPDSEEERVRARKAAGYVDILRISTQFR